MSNRAISRLFSLLHQ